MNEKIKGYLFGALAAACYGANPLFALPMNKMGISMNSILFYRYIIALFIFFILIKFVKKVPLKIKKNQIIPIFILGVLFAVSSVTLYDSFRYIDAGIACTILFIYPVIVALIMILFYGEKVQKGIIISIFITLFGIALLYDGNVQKFSIKGVFVVLLSALSYALYIVKIKTTREIRRIDSFKLCFYALLFGLVVLISSVNFGANLDPLNTPNLWLLALGLAIFPTICSIEFLNLSIKMIGSIPTSILGALEPLTAIFFGVTIFGEVLTPKNIAGIILILFAVLTVILEKAKKEVTN